MVDPIAFVLIFIRITIMMMFIPIFGSQTVPWIAKMGFCGFLALSLLSSINVDFSEVGNCQIILSIISDFLVAIAIGLVIRFIFDGIQFAGECISYQMGLTVMNVIDPISATQTPIISQLKQIIALFIFFAINGHHQLIRIIAESFRYIPLSGVNINKSLLYQVITLSGLIFTIAIKLSAPILIAMFIANLTMGIIARTMPQINIFILSFPLYIGLTLVIMGIFMPFFIKFIKNCLNCMILNANKIIAIAGV